MAPAGATLRAQPWGATAGRSSRLPAAPRCIVSVVWRNRRAAWHGNTRCGPPHGCSAKQRQAWKLQMAARLCSGTRGSRRQHTSQACAAVHQQRGCCPAPCGLTFPARQAQTRGQRGQCSWQQQSPSVSWRIPGTRRLRRSTGAEARANCAGATLVCGISMGCMACMAQDAVPSARCLHWLHGTGCGHRQPQADFSPCCRASGSTRCRQSQALRGRLAYAEQQRVAHAVAHCIQRHAAAHGAENARQYCRHRERRRHRHALGQGTSRWMGGVSIRVLEPGSSQPGTRLYT